MGVVSAVAVPVASEVQGDDLVAVPHVVEHHAVPGAEAAPPRVLAAHLGGGDAVYVLQG